MPSVKKSATKIKRVANYSGASDSDDAFIDDDEGDVENDNGLNEGRSDEPPRVKSKTSTASAKKRNSTKVPMISKSHQRWSSKFNLSIDGL
jgi:hypothetical protein